MSVIDIRFRVDAICNKYDKYDIAKQRELNANDSFAQTFHAVENEINATISVRSFFLFVSPPFHLLALKFVRKGTKMLTF